MTQTSTTRELHFRAELEWRGEQPGSGSVTTGGQTVPFSVPAAMGGGGIGTDPEGLLASAVGACYTATLAAILLHTRLPYRRLTVSSELTVVDFPGAHARIASVRVSPTIVGGEAARREEYLTAATRARERCFVGRHLNPSVSYEVGAVCVA